MTEPGLAARYGGEGALRGMDRLAREDEEARVTLCRQCGIDPDRVTPESPKQPLQLRKYRNPTRRADRAKG